MSEPACLLIDFSRSDALDLGWLDVIRHHARHLSRHLPSQLFSSKILRLSASVHSSFEMSETVVHVVITQLR
jgi:hypothetical protein